jgi:hypothetical protein
MKITIKNSKLFIKDIHFITLNFAAGIQNSSSTAIDDIFIDSARLSSSCTSPIVSSPSDHNAHFLTVNNITTKVNLIPLKQKQKNK